MNDPTSKPSHLGTLRSWNDERGYGFIAPKDGSRELFVHITAFPRDGSRPTPGETLVFERGPGKDGKPQAVKVYRQAVGPASEAPRRSRQPAAPRPSSWHIGQLASLVGAIAVCALGFLAAQRYLQRPAPPAISSTPIHSLSAMPESAPAASQRCDGRTHCSQMTSCAEAQFFLSHCPGTQMDGDGDGVPCEQQWCG